jgi:hypothetical protein
MLAAGTLTGENGQSPALSLTRLLPRLSRKCLWTFGMRRGYNPTGEPAGDGRASRRGVRQGALLARACRRVVTHTVTCPSTWGALSMGR